jgi:hypothetical protein
VGYVFGSPPQPLVPNQQEYPRSSDQQQWETDCSYRVADLVRTCHGIGGWDPGYDSPSERPDRLLDGEHLHPVNIYGDELIGS